MHGPYFIDNVVPDGSRDSVHVRWLFSNLSLRPPKSTAFISPTPTNGPTSITLKAQTTTSSVQISPLAATPLIAGGLSQSAKVEVSIAVPLFCPALLIGVLFYHFSVAAETHNIPWEKLEPKARDPKPIYGNNVSRDYRISFT